MEENEKKEMSTSPTSNEVSEEQTFQTPVEPIQQVEATSPTPAPTPQVQTQPEIKTSGTATEEEIVIDASKPAAEVLDEYEIKRDVVQEQKKYKKNITFIIIVILLIVMFIVLMPFIVKQIGF